MRTMMHWEVKSPQASTMSSANLISGVSQFDVETAQLTIKMLFLQIGLLLT